MGKLIKIVVVVAILGAIGYGVMVMTQDASDVQSVDRPAVSPEEKLGFTTDTAGP